MASSVECLECASDLLRDVPAVTHKKMMGEYLHYSREVLFGGICDDRFLLKGAPAARAAFPEGQAPYEGAKTILLVGSEDPVLIAEVVTDVHAELPKPKGGR